MTKSGHTALAAVALRCGRLHTHTPFTMKPVAQKIDSSESGDFDDKKSVSVTGTISEVKNA